MSNPFTIDAQLLATIDDLSLIAKNVVEGFLSGLHRSPFLGYSTEFDSYRPYQQGDDFRYIDWKVWGRTDQLYVKQFEDDTNLACHVLLDASGSMDFGNPNKFQYARLLTAAFAYLMIRQHDAAGLIKLSDKTAEMIPARGGRHHLQDIFISLSSALAQGTFSNTSIPFGALFKRKGLVVLISDLLSPGEHFQELFKQLHMHRQEAVVFHLVAPEEIDFEISGEYLMEDAETSARISVDASVFRREYLKRFEEFCELQHKICEEYEFDYLRLRSDESLDKALIAYLEKRRTT